MCFRSLVLPKQQEAMMVKNLTCIHSQNSNRIDSQENFSWELGSKYRQVLLKLFFCV